jgi:hypothetical protein
MEKILIADDDGDGELHKVESMAKDELRRDNKGDKEGESAREDLHLLYSYAIFGQGQLLY